MVWIVTRSNAMKKTTLTAVMDCNTGKAIKMGKHYEGEEENLWDKCSYL
jgi:hypothetical protein